MAKNTAGKRRPRIRKSAPTIREKVEAARTSSDLDKPGPLKRQLKNAGRPLKKLDLGSRRPVKLIIKPFGYLKRVLAWLIPKYFTYSWRELRQVIWPSRRETWRLTLAVFIFAVVFGAMVAGVDKGLDLLFKKVVLK